MYKSAEVNFLEGGALYLYFLALLFWLDIWSRFVCLIFWQNFYHYKGWNPGGLVNRLLWDLKYFIKIFWIHSLIVQTPKANLKMLLWALIIILETKFVIIMAVPRGVIYNRSAFIRLVIGREELSNFVWLEGLENLPFAVCTYLHGWM